MNDSKRVCTMIYAPAECSAFGITLEGGNECDARGRMEDELLAQGHNASDFSAITCKSLPL